MFELWQVWREIMKHASDFLKSYIKSKARDESGAMTIFALFVFVMMIMVCGISVDLMLNEMERVKRQNALDRALLAAADLDQELDPESVVRDYFNKTGLEGDMVEITATNLQNNRRIEASLATSSHTGFMGTFGINSLPIYVAGTAQESAPNVEISLALDISGSMRFSNRMTNLRPAAQDFIDAVLQGPLAATTSINLVPYAGQTNPGPFMFNRMGGQRYAAVELAEELGGIEDPNDDEVFWYPNVSSCMELQDVDFTSAGLPNLGYYEQTAHFMNWGIAASVMDWGWCPQDSTAIQYAQNNATALKTFIGNMRMHDGTGTPYAMKYALALLDPSSRDDFNAMANVGLVPDDFRVRPADWEDPDTVKYIILMTDGQITQQYRPSDTIDEDNPTVELNARTGDRVQIASQNTMIDRFYEVCDLAKAEPREVIVYTIAFEAPAAAQTQMKTCASSPSHYYNATGTEIGDVFRAIARSILQLQLTN